jgi:hypothetical protein
VPAGRCDGSASSSGERASVRSARGDGGLGRPAPRRARQASPARACPAACAAAAGARQRADVERLETSLILLAACGALGATVLSGCSTDRGGLDFSGGVCREHELVFACSPLAETCGCAPEQGCRALGLGARACAPAGEVERGEPCRSDTDCGSEDWCAAGVCREVCDLRFGGLPCARGPCATIVVDGETIADLGVCEDDGCDPIAQTGCAIGLSCLLGRARDRPYATCGTRVDGAGLRERCDGDRPCAPGMLCLEIVGEHPRICRALCVAGDDGPCASLGSAGDARCTGDLAGFWNVDGRALGYCAE